MIIYRPHKGSLANSIKLAEEFNDEQEMKEYIVKQHNNAFNIEDIVIEDKTYSDSRIAWEDTRDICIKRCGKDVFIHPQCIGMCATKYKK